LEEDKELRKKVDSLRQGGGILQLKTELQRAVGKNNLIADPGEFNHNAFGICPNESRVPDFVAFPGNVAEIQEILSIANKYSTPVIPSSSGVHFRGGTFPSEGGIVVDLTRMDKILEVDAKNRKARIEPGVRWGKLQPELARHGLMALNPLFPSPLQSVVTSHLEREPILISKYEYSDPLYTAEIILADGRILRAGSAAAPGAPEGIADLVNPFGPGMDFLRLFQGAQGTLGIVTWATIKLEYLPSRQQFYFIPLNRPEELAEPLYAIQRRMIGNECLILNKKNLATILSECWPEDYRELMNTLPPYLLVVALTGIRRAEERIAYEAEALQEICSGLGLELLLNLPAAGRREHFLVENIRKAWRDGDTYWKFKNKGRCLDIEFHATADKLLSLHCLILNACRKHGYPAENLGVYIQPLERCRVCFFGYGLEYDPKNKSEVGIVDRVSREAAEALLNSGAFISTPSGPFSEMVFSRAAGYSEALKTLKRTLDPNRILNPGKLCF
jgi:FAD/FMN-containing dehydrogenase